MKLLKEEFNDILEKQRIKAVFQPIHGCNKKIIEE